MTPRHRVVRPGWLLASLLFVELFACIHTGPPDCPARSCPGGQVCSGTVDSGSICCGAPGTSCSSASDCCAGCTAGQCGCLDVFEHVACRSDADCCHGRCGTDAGWWTCIGRATGAPCATADDCISSICSAGTCACTPEGQGTPCLEDSDCCVGTCSKQSSALGHCCYRAGAACQVGTECCSGKCAPDSGGALLCQ